MGANGERALDQLRTAVQMLKEPDRWPRPFETVQAACRSALDALLKEAGEDFEGPRAAQEQVNTEVAALLKQAAKQGQTPLDKLLAAIDAADVPDVLEQKAGLGAGVQRLIRIPDGRLPVPADPRAEYEAVRELLNLAERLATLPPPGMTNGRSSRSCAAYGKPVMPPEQPKQPPGRTASPVYGTRGPVTRGR
ncbi:hypothetical protein [Streptomyces sp. AM 3-1-1]|uniref:hypothetical protein n=1 Tax=Streptomyces sp. AM 3-1-1 TaxID=3028711 RepID=UPI0023B8D705|nr:hypothetical protein [Streptomyces sp. AM 3-1-1]WEH28067.1 hypothetical protein P0D76_12400 [Streptomyces sp. AM 3-1-1]